MDAHDTVAAASGLTVETILERAHPASRAILEALFVDNERLLDPMRRALAGEALDAYLRDVETIGDLIRRVGAGDADARRAEAIRGLQFHSVDFLRRQAQFIATGDYQADSASSVYEDVYQQPSVMQEYLDGLLLTYVAWPNHRRLIEFYRERYLGHGRSGRCLEIGTGHGWLALLQLEADPGNTLLGIDISPHSVAYTQALLAAGGIGAERWTVREGDATKGFDCNGERFDRIVMAEVLEHVEDPAFLLREAVAHAHPHTLVFLSTVVNIEAIDHLYLYRSLEEVRAMLADCGLAIIDELDMPLEFAAAETGSYEVALVCRPEAVA
jgi:2-polyprenyl-3-methyl-5-hydroxy-6-metoxy-1,4-benzoquinol methylase